MDIVVSTGMGETSLVDLAVVNAAAQSKVIGRQRELLAANWRGAAFVQGYAAADREEWKRREAAKALDATQTANFKPFVMELSGRLGEGARAFIGQMERCHNARLGDIEGPIAFRKLRAHFFLEMGMVLARGTASGGSGDGEDLGACTRQDQSTRGGRRGWPPGGGRGGQRIGRGLRRG